MIPIVGIGAGLVSALLFSVVITGSPLAALLYSAAPLPIFIALAPTGGIAFALIIGLPAWWIAYLALLARGDIEGRVEWYPLGNLLLWIAATAALATVGSALVMTTDYETYRSVIARMIENLLGEMVRGKLIALPADIQVKELADSLAPAVPLGIGASFVTTITANLWLAARTVKMSDRLPRPWPFIPSTTLPRQALLLLIAGAFVATTGGFIGVAAMAFVGALLAAFMFSGLATLHDISRGRAWRMPMLISVYVALVVRPPRLTPLLAIAGVIDTLLGLRRQAALPPPPTRS